MIWIELQYMLQISIKIIKRQANLDAEFGNTRLKSEWTLSKKQSN